MKNDSGKLVFSPGDLITYLASPFASWMDRYRLENPDALVPDAVTEDQKLIAETGDAHEQAVLGEWRVAVPGLVEIPKSNAGTAQKQTITAIRSKAPVIYQEPVPPAAKAYRTGRGVEK